jgi:hypothetical protein
MKLGMPAGMASVVLQTQAFITMLLAAAFLHEAAALAMDGLAHRSCRAAADRYSPW